METTSVDSQNFYKGDRMIIKYRSYDGRWNWFSQVEEVKSLGYIALEDIPKGDDLSPLGTPDDSKLPYVLHVCRGGRVKVLALYAQEAYLTEDSTGNTIDILIPKVHNEAAK